MTPSRCSTAYRSPYRAASCSASSVPTGRARRRCSASAPLIVQELYESVRQIAKEGISILVVEQFAKTVLGVADVAAIMTQGQIVRVGAPEELGAELQSAYLGGAVKKKVGASRTVSSNP